MLDAQALAKTLAGIGVTRWYGVPDSLLSPLITAMLAVDTIESTTTANEGAAVAAAAGHFLATGESAGVYLQNSGVGNAINPLTSLAHRDVYSIPMLLLIGWRGQPGTVDEPQHMAQGRATRPMLEAAGVVTFELDSSAPGADAVLSEAHAASVEQGSPVAVLVPPGILPKAPIPMAQTPALPTRESAIGTIMEMVDDAAVLVATTGKTGRELFELRRARHEDPTSDYLNVGAMGHAPAVALGMAVARPDKTIILLDGDGAAAMHLGTQLTIANTAPGNLIHLLFNNGSHESVGGQSTHLGSSDLGAIALAAGYQSTTSVETLRELSGALTEAMKDRGPAFIEVLVQTGSRSDLGRPTATLQESRDAIRRKFER